MRFVLSVLAVFERYATFEGRAGRPEYWWFQLFLVIVFTFTTFIDHAFKSLLFTVFAALAFILPALSVGVRRLHDTGRDGTWIFVGLVPIAGALALIVWNLQRGDDGENRFGPAPRHPATLA